MTVRDDGRGIPTDIHHEEGVSAAEVVLTRLHAGGKFNQNSYKVSGGLHGVGAAVVNALSDWMHVRIWRNGSGALSSASRAATRWRRSRWWGRPTRSTARRSRSSPAPSTFTKTEFDYAILEKRLRELAFLNSGLRIRLCDERHAPRAGNRTFHYEGGLVEFVRYLDRSKTPVLPEPISVHHAREPGGHPGRVRAGRGTTASTRPCCASPTTSRSATAAATWPGSARR